MYKHYNNSLPILYLDSSKLLRNNNLSYLTNSFTRKKYDKDPQTFMNKLNSSLSLNIEKEVIYNNLLIYLINQNYISQIITMDITLSNLFSHKILNLFGCLTNNTQITPEDFITSSICLFNDNISTDTYKLCYSIIKKEFIVIVDDNFLALSIGRAILNKSTSPFIFKISEIEGTGVVPLKTQTITTTLIHYFNLSNVLDQ